MYTKVKRVLKTKANTVNTDIKHLFWDMDRSKLSTKEDKALIIPRMLLATTKESFLKDISNLERTYTPKEIYSILKNTKERVSNNVCRMVAQRYDKPVFLRYKF